MRDVRTALALVAGVLLIGIAAIQQPGIRSLNRAHRVGLWGVPLLLNAQVTPIQSPPRPTHADVEAALAWADQESKKAVEQAQHGLDPLFARAKRNAPGLRKVS